MLSKDRILRVSLCLLVLGLVAVVPMFAGSAVVGSVAGSTNATVGGQAVLPNATLFSGDNLQVKDGMAVVALGSSSRMMFGRDTVASFLRESNEVTVLLGQGSVSLFHDANGAPVRMKVGSVSVAPVPGIKTLGEVATLNGAVVVTAKEGTLRVEGNGQVVNVVKGKTITVVPRTNAPQGGGGGMSGATILEIVAAGAAGGALIVDALALSRANDAKNNSASAASAAAAAAAAASSAVSAANSVASAAAAANNALGCALDVLANSEGQASPYTPPAGETCP